MKKCKFRNQKNHTEKMLKNGLFKGNFKAENWKLKIACILGVSSPILEGKNAIFSNRLNKWVTGGDKV